MPRTDERGGPQTRQRISNIATALFLDRGFDSVTVAEVAREAGVSSVTVFNHFPRKEDLLFDREDLAAELLRSAVRDRASDVDVLDSLRQLTLRMVDDRHALSGLKDDRTVSFFRTVAASPTLVARAREIAAELEAGLVDELRRDSAFGGDAVLVSALFLAGYRTLLLSNARRLLAGERADALLDEHRAALERLFASLRNGLAV